MKTLTTSMLLSVIFLTAGAFAGASHGVHTAPIAKPVVKMGAENVTVVGKNRVWPPAGQISVEPCNLRRCLDA